MARNPSDNRYWIIGYLFIAGKGADGFQYITEGGDRRMFKRYIKGDVEHSLRFQPNLLFDEAFIKELSLGKEWGHKASSEIDWITRHTRSRASCIYISNRDAVAILQTYKKYTTNEKHKRAISEVLKVY